jgi:hypothetical protein
MGRATACCSPGPVAARSGEGVDRGGACRAHAKGRLGRLLKLSSTLLLTEPAPEGPGLPEFHRCLGNLVDGHFSDERTVVLAARLGSVTAAYGAVDLPRGQGTMPRPPESSAVQHVATPEDADRWGSYGCGQMEWSSVVRDDDGRAREHADQSAQRDGITGLGRGSAHAVKHFLHQRTFLPGARHDHASAGCSETVAYHGESGRRPPAASIAGTRVQHCEWTVDPVKNRCRLLYIVLRYGQTRLEDARNCIQQRRHLQISEDLMLIVEVGHPPIERLGIWGPQSDCVASAEAPDERIRMEAAPMHLYRDVEALVPQALQSLGGHGCLCLLLVSGADASNRRQDEDAIDGSWATSQELVVQRPAE